jgi:arylsulfatase B
VDSGVDGAASVDGGPAGDAAPLPGDAGLSDGPNILLLIADDLGVDAFGLYGDSDGDGTPDDGRSYAATPNLDAVCGEGVRFSRAWSAPMCSPTRASILTGRYGFRTGIGTAIGRVGGLDVGEPTLPRIMGAHGYRTASLGKWHLGTMGDLGGRSAPQTMGWSYFSGILLGALMDYEDWNRVENGELHPETRYATTANVDDALGWLNSEQSDAPWLLWMGFNAPHAPFHRPPDDLHSQSLDGVNLMSAPQPYYRAMIEAMDTEVGRLLAGIAGHNDRETVVIFIGDNGTPGRVIEAPLPRAHSKESLFEGGVHVPFCVRGPGITGGRTSDALVHTVDLFRTILDFAGIEPTAEELSDLPNDSLSFGPVLTADMTGERDFIYTESFGNPRAADGRAVREARYKLIVYATGEEFFFDLQEDPIELTNLLEGEPLSAEESAALERLRGALATLEP